MKATVTRKDGKKVNVYIPKNESDAEQPKFMFCCTSTSLLAAIVNGEIDAVELAKKELSNRGLNNDGLWVGFGK